MYEVNYQQRRRRLFCLAPADIMTKYPAANTNSLERAGPRNGCKVDNNDTNKLTECLSKKGCYKVHYKAEQETSRHMRG